jgi:hypothetical protein
MPIGGLIAGHVALNVGKQGRVCAVRAEGFLDNGVENAVPPYGGRAGIRQEGKRDSVAAGKAAQDLPRVIGDRRQSETVLAEFLDPALQLDELRAAERSPIRRSEEHQHGAARPHDRFQIAGAAGVIRQAEIRDALPDLRPEPGDVHLLPRRLDTLACAGSGRLDEEHENRHQRRERPDHAPLHRERDHNRSGVDRFPTRRESQAVPTAREDFDDLSASNCLRMS